MKKGDCSRWVQLYGSEGDILQVKSMCTCDDVGDSPCPIHHRENLLQDENIRLRNELEVMRSVYAHAINRPDATALEAVLNIKALINDLQADLAMLVKARDVQVETMAAPIRISEQGPIWDAINEYAESYNEGAISVRQMNAAANVIKAINSLLNKGAGVSDD